MPMHEFQLVLDPWLNGSESGRYVDLKVNPPAGCVVREYSTEPDRLFLECRRDADSRLDAIAQVVGEIRRRFGLPDADDLGIEKLWEFMGNSDSTIDLIAQLSLMAVRRAELIGIDLETSSRSSAPRLAVKVADDPIRVSQVQGRLVSGPMRRSSPPHAMHVSGRLSLISRSDARCHSHWTRRCMPAT